MYLPAVDSALTVVNDALTRDLFDPPALCLASPLTEAAFALLPEEQALARGVTPRRRRELATGRACARELLRRLGIAGSTPLLREPSGAPSWPPGVCGSISHTRDRTRDSMRDRTRDLCVVVVAPAERAGGPGGVGIDVERDRAVGPKLWPRVCTERERAWLAARPAASRDLLATVLFSAKESILKASFPVLERRPGFRELDVELLDWSEERGHFRAALPAGTASRVAGRFLRREGWVLTGAVRTAEGGLAEGRGAA